ncbi:uncharacterized protein ARMOST_22438 [Armillaria ostoyae]|uniref:Uncharacterized protein n=1 Tax=Armillaria ostoyae TaxID=47428 RepID=A0A284SCW6_ARMOS|nr:uncharacterized protein ARMOST_22438 [Armillaria ostoyae]
MSTLDNDAAAEAFSPSMGYATAVPRRSVPRPPPHRHVLIWGCSPYEPNPLHGCVSDASLIRSFLIDDFGVPEERIQCLLGPKILIPGNPLTPSRTNIIVDVLYNLIDD